MAKSSSMLLSMLVAMLAVFLAFYTLKDSSESQDVRLEPLLNSLLRHESEHVMREGVRIAIGYGACMDLFVNASDVLHEKEVEWTPEHSNVIQNVQQLRNTFAYFFKHGAAAERFVSDNQVFDQLLKEARGSPHHREALGGNAPVMALRFAREGVSNVLLAARMTSKMTTLLPQTIRVADETVTESEDFHLILEYKRLEKWSRFQAPRANRFIVHSDENNPKVSSLEAFELALEDYRPALLVVSGLQMMDNYPFVENERLDRLLKVQKQMTSQTSDTRIHFEMASFVDQSLLIDLANNVIPYADSLGMNEQELPNLISTLKFGNVSIVADSNPRVATVLDDMRQVFKLLRNRASQGHRQLTRIHVHTLAYQAIATVEGSEWKDTEKAAAKASLVANRHVCASQKVDLSKAFIILDEGFATSATDSSARRIVLDASEAVSCWKEKVDDIKLNVCVATNLVCSDAKQTAGGGDNISAAGLVLQV